MIKGKKLPAVSENINLSKAIKIISNTNLGVLIIKKKNGNTSGIITDGDFKRIAQKYPKFEHLKISKVMTKNPITIDKDKLATTALSIMNSRKITSLCVNESKNKKRTIGLIHMHDILNSNIS